MPDSPGSTGSTGSGGKKGRFPRNAIIGALAIIVLALFGTVAALALTATSSTAAVDLEPVGTPGVKPFMPPVGTDQPGLKVPPKTGGTYSGGTPGLYGGTMRRASCNPQQLVSFLRVHPDKAAAWASVLGIQPADIPGYVAGLTSAVLRSDTAVTNHGYIDGHVTSFPAVLQAGTAVLIDRYGQPVTKCFCGNPLTKPLAYTNPTYTGKSWPSFSVTSVTYIQQTTTIENGFTLVNPNTGTTFHRPPDSSGSADKPVTTPATGFSTTPTTGTGTTPTTGNRHHPDNGDRHHPDNGDRHHPDKADRHHPDNGDRHHPDNGDWHHPDNGDWHHPDNGDRHHPDNGDRHHPDNRGPAPPRQRGPAPPRQRGPAPPRQRGPAPPRQREARSPRQREPPPTCNFGPSSDYRTPVHLRFLASACAPGTGSPDAPRTGRGRLGTAHSAARRRAVRHARSGNQW